MYMHHKANGSHLSILKISVLYQRKTWERITFPHFK